MFGRAGFVGSPSLGTHFRSEAQVSQSLFVSLFVASDLNEQPQGPGRLGLGAEKESSRKCTRDCVQDVLFRAGRNGRSHPSLF